MMPEQKVEQIDLFNYMNDQMSFQAETQSPTKSEQISRLKYFWNNQILRFHVIRKGVVHSLRTYSRTLHIKSCSLIVIRKLSEQAKRGAARIRYGIGVVYDYMKKDRDEFCKGLRCLSMPAEPPEAASDGSRISNLMGLAPWVNVYKVTRAYGGSEHGGWYYRKYTCEKSVQVWRWNAESTAAMYQRTYEKLAWGLICSEAEGLEIAVLIETKKAQLQGRKNHLIIRTLL
ncbi:hypothetical protein JI735_33715 (plasmid) [Paenibacillus sonchi]|uniref:Uncharacterized protein n=1 Tax=Paenibacillus sonchi TaxID=373687 RepID=A0A974PJ14_9BACL|nr:hypothetical protein [Paenibacillus sonchi]QQZ64610.1 hypothetical protein JI735_33715 [Paenibacillus sonchi]